MGSIYKSIIIFIFILTVILSWLLRKKWIKSYFLIISYFVILIVYLSNKMNDVREYYLYNEKKFSQVSSITINNSRVKKENYAQLFEELKHDQFSWVNHPIKRKEYVINIYIQNKIFRFQIWDTYNQGVLVSRVNANGEEFVINRNDKILFYLK